MTGVKVDEQYGMTTVDLNNLGYLDEPFKDMTDMSEDYNKFAEIPPFGVKIDPSIALNKEDAPWLRRRRIPEH